MKNRQPEAGQVVRIGIEMQRFIIGTINQNR
jgi:hypothetical protein